MEKFLQEQANGLRYWRWVGVDSAWEQRKLEARKMLAVGRADSPASSARGVGQCMPCHAPNFSRIMLTR